VPTGTTVAEAIALRDGVVYRRLADNQVISFGAMGFYPSLVPPVPSITATNLSLGVFLDVIFAIRPDGTVTAWGSNTTGMLTIPAGLSGVTQVAGGVEHALAMNSAGNLFNWGNGVVPGNGLGIPVGWSGATAIAAGRGFSLGVFASAPNGAAPANLRWAIAPTLVGGTGAGAAVGQVVVSDVDPGDRAAFALVSGPGSTNNALFSLSNASVQVAGTLPTDAQTLSIRVRATDSGGLSTEASLAITVTAAPATEENDDSKGFLGCGLGGGVSVFLVLFLNVIRLRREQCS
jgi:hypothetical protein